MSLPLVLSLSASAILWWTLVNGSVQATSREWMTQVCAVIPNASMTRRHILMTSVFDIALSCHAFSCRMEKKHVCNLGHSRIWWRLISFLSDPIASGVPRLCDAQTLCPAA